MSDKKQIKGLFSAENESCLTLEQVTAYQEGKLSAAEKHAAERHLLDCELCAMAFEGLVDLPVAEAEAGAQAITEAAWQRVAQLESRRRKGAWIWVSAAASVVLIAAFGYFWINQHQDQGTDLPTLADNYSDPLPPPPAGELDKYSMDHTAESKGNRMEAVTETMAGGGSPAEETDAFSSGGGMGAGPVVAPAPSVSELTEKSRPMKELLASADSPMEDIEVMEEELDVMVVEEYTRADKDAVEYEELWGDEDQDFELLADAPAMKGGMNDDGNMQIELGPKEERSLADGLYLEESEVATRSAAVTDMKSIAQNNAVVTHDLGNAPKRKKEDNRGAGKTSESVRADQKAVTVAEVDEEEDGKADQRSPEGNGFTIADSVTFAFGNGATSTTYDQGMEAYRAERFRDAATLLKSAAESTPANLQAHLYAGISFLEIKQPQAALFHFERILAAGNSSYREDAEWYKAMAYLQLNDRTRAQSSLEQIQRGNTKYKKKAAEVLDEL